MRRAIVGLGAGGHARTLVEILTSHGEFEIVGLLDPDPALSGAKPLGVPVLGDDSQLPRLRTAGVRLFFVGVGGTGDNRPRQRVFERAREAGLEPLTIVHPRAALSPSSQLAAGVSVLAQAVVGTGARLAENVLVNTAAVVEHDCELAPHVHLAPGARLAGGVHVGSGAHVGLGALVLEGRSVGAGALVGAGAVVVRDVPPGATVAGVPAQPIARGAAR